METLLSARNFSEFSSHNSRPSSSHDITSESHKGKNKQKAEDIEKDENKTKEKKERRRLTKAFTK